MRKRKYGIKRKYVIALCLSAIAAVLAISASIAAYTNQGYQKGVVATNASDIRFSSNLLKLYAENSDVANRDNSTLSLADRRSIRILVNNYPNENPGQYNTNVVNYEITCRIESTNEDYELIANGYSVSGCTGPTVSGSALEFSGNGNFLGTGTQSAVYTINIGSADAVGNIKIIVTVEPADQASSAVVGNNILYRTLVPVAAGSGTENVFDWHGAFADAGTTPPGDYHAFNYEISGTTGVGTVVLSWDYSKVSIDPFFLEKMEIQEMENGNTHSVTFNVNATEVKNYIVLFYRNVPDAGETWENMGTVITCTATQAS